jgi:hypothetical protein
MVWKFIAICRVRVGRCGMAQKLCSEGWAVDGRADVVDKVRACAGSGACCGGGGGDRCAVNSFRYVVSSRR